MSGSDPPADDVRAWDGQRTEALSDAGAERLVQRIRLEVLEGPDAGGRFVSDGDRTVVGTHASADVVLSDRAVSRFHCELSCTEDGVTLRDRGSRNGTRVDGVSVVEAHLHDGAVVSVGRTQLRVALAADRARVTLSERCSFGRLVGRSPAMRAVFAQLERAARSDATVLLLGETGTGKEVTAESVHLSGDRRDGPFVVVDCGAVPAPLLASELFGHDKGAFTGATAARRGAFEAAHGGTILIDEIGELDPELQPKLLRALERKEIKRVGGNEWRRVDVRVIAATHRDLARMVNERSFRSDLYYRLAVLEVRLPPLRERREDLPLLVDRILESLGARGEAAEDLRSDRFRRDLSRHTWPGNVRELRNYVERCLVLRERAPLPKDPRAGERDFVDTGKPFKEARDEHLHAFERRYLEALLERHGGNVSAAARDAELDRIYLYRLLWRHGLR